MTFIRNNFSEEINCCKFSQYEVWKYNLSDWIFYLPFSLIFSIVFVICSLIILRTNLALVGHCELWGSWAFFLTKRDNSSGDWISTATRNYENYKMASRSPGGLEWSISIKPLLIAPSASLDVEILPKFCKSITLRYGIENLYVTL